MMSCLHKLEDRKCAVCGKTFAPVRRNQVTCSRECSHNRAVKKQKDYVKKMAQALKATYAKRQCAVCGKTFAPERKNNVCCSSECTSAYRPAQDESYWRRRLGCDAKDKLIEKLQNRLSTQNALLGQLRKLCKEGDYAGVFKVLDALNA